LGNSYKKGYNLRANAGRKRIVRAAHELNFEAFSKPQIALKDKAQTDEKAQHIREHVSILKRPATPSASVRWGLETASWGIVIFLINRPDAS
jgi:DNA-binding MurR/RpiR family transcriptional regulator